MDMLTDIFNTAVTNKANEILAKYRPVKKPWVTTDIFDLCAKRRKLKNKRKTKIEMEWHSTEQLTKKSRKA